MHSSCDNETVRRVFKYVDDFSVVLNKQCSFNYHETANAILDTFNRHRKGLTFTHEFPSHDTLQFLDINFRFLSDHVCWIYCPYASARSKMVNRAVASLALESALKKSCVHAIPESFDAELKRLQSVGYPSFVLVGAAEALLRKAKGHVHQKPAEQSKAKPVVLPYIHRLCTT